MDAPPPYVKEESKSSLDTKALPAEGYAGQLDLRLELRCGRAERIHAMAAQVRKILNSRAQGGLSRSTLVFVPSGQDITGVYCFCKLKPAVLTNYRGGCRFENRDHDGQQASARVVAGPG